MAYSPLIEITLVYKTFWCCKNGIIGFDKLLPMGHIKAELSENPRKLGGFTELGRLTEVISSFSNSDSL